jgi:hypothetical protein
MTTLGMKVPCQQFMYSCDTPLGAIIEQQLRDYDRKRWAHRHSEQRAERLRRPRRDLGEFCFHFKYIWDRGRTVQSTMRHLKQSAVRMTKEIGIDRTKGMRLRLFCGEHGRTCRLPLISLLALLPHVRLALATFSSNYLPTKLLPNPSACCCT